MRSTHIASLVVMNMVVLLGQLGCSPGSAPPSNNSNQVNTTATPVRESAETTSSAIPQCDESLLQHVYKPQRLIVKNNCIAVTGTIVDATASQSKHQPDGVRHEQDGDSHGWLKVDSQFQNLLNAGNASDEGGNLVFEIVCEFPVTQQDARAACQGYTNQIKVPPMSALLVSMCRTQTTRSGWRFIRSLR